MNFEQPRWTRSLATPVVLAWATLGPVGTNFPAPGTWGSVAGLVYFLLGFRYMGVTENLVVSAVGSGQLETVTARIPDAGQADPHPLRDRRSGA